MPVKPEYIEFSNEEFQELSRVLHAANHIHTKPLARLIDRSIGQFTTKNIFSSLNCSFEDRESKSAIFFDSLADLDLKINNPPPVDIIAIWRLKIGRER